MIIGIFAHVDAGKTSLTESLLYNSNMIKSPGRIDEGNTVLDYSQIERERGITIHCNGTYIEHDSERIYIIDTPGHVDFAPETARAVAALDAAILVVSASDGMNAHTKQLHSLLDRNNIPTVVFVNKTDMPGTSRDSLYSGVKMNIGNAVDFTDDGHLEDIATYDETLTDYYLENGTLQDEQIAESVLRGKITPVFFGSALKNVGVGELLTHLLLLAVKLSERWDIRDQSAYLENRSVVDESSISGTRSTFDKSNASLSLQFVVYRISHDSKGLRLIHIAVKSGTLNAKDVINGEKVNEIRIYNGDRFATVTSVIAGTACVITGPGKLQAGDIVSSVQPSGTSEWLITGASNDFEPVMGYRVVAHEDITSYMLSERLKYFEDEEPCLHITHDTAHDEVRVMLMGEIHAQILAAMYENKYGSVIEFSEGSVLYKETIDDAVTGIGHYEPLRHFAEAVIEITPLQRGSGIRYETKLSQDELDINWQRLIMTHLAEKAHLGVLTGSPITDVCYTLVGGKAHLKHTEGGDFRQATYRAVRQGLMQAKSILLEPIYSFEIVVGEVLVGRIMSEIEKRCGECALDGIADGRATLSGKVPASTMSGFERELASFSKGEGSMILQFCGYEQCHNADEVIAEKGYDPEADTENTPSSIYCSHGAGHVVRWDELTP